MLNYFVVKCPKCEKVMMAFTYKSKYEATFHCRFCKASKKLYRLKVGLGYTPTEFYYKNVFYFGPSQRAAKEILLQIKGVGKNGGKTTKVW